MTRRWLAAGVATLALGATLALAQGAPEDLLPPAPNSPAPNASASAAPGAEATVSATAGAPDASAGEAVAPRLDLSRLPSLQQLEAMSTDELDELFGLRPRYDIPTAARRAVEQVGVIAPDEGGLPVYSLARQPESLVRAALAGAKGPVVSRWGHILLRRALASRMDAPQGMDPVEFAALRAAALNAMGENAVARALVQDVDTGNYNAALTDAAIDAYIGTGDVAGACPAILIGRSTREDPEWKMLAGVCHAYDGEETRAQNDLRKLQVRGEGERIDTLLAMRLAGAAGSGRKSVTIEWNNVNAMTPYRFAMINAVGETMPEGLAGNLAPIYLQRWATAPMATLDQRLSGASLAGQAGVLSATAMVDLYSYAFAGQDGSEDNQTAATQLREAYVAEDPANRLAAIKSLWDGGKDYRYGRMVLTAYAAARMVPSSDFNADAGALIGSMLAAGLDRDAARWSDVVEDGSLGWALLALAAPGEGATVSKGDVDSFVDDDDSTGKRKSRMLVAGLTGLGRMSASTATGYSAELKAGMGGDTRWTRAIDAAAAADNKALVALLAGLGMQGDSWDQMTARHLFHIVSALNRVGLGAEARMIAAEAVSRA